MQTLTIDKNNILASVSQSDYDQNGGYSPESKGHNLLKEKGVIHGMPTVTDLSANLLDNVIGTTRDRNFLGNDVYLLDASGNYYTLNGSTLTKRKTDSTNTYAFGTSDIINFQGEVFATSQGDITRLTGSDLATIDETWWTVTLGLTALDANYRHPLEVVEDTMYIGDKKMIHTWDGTTGTYNALPLPTDQNITAMIKHPNGRDLIVFTSGTANYSHINKGQGKIYVVDTLTLEFVNEVEIDEQVEGAINVNGTIFVTYGQNLGFLSGLSISWLRDLNISYSSSELGYKHHLSSIDNHLLVVEDDAVLAFGDLGEGNAFWYPIKDGTIDFIINSIENKLLYGTTSGSTAKLFERDFDDAGVLGNWRSNKISFPKDVWIRRIDIIHTETNGSGTSSFSVTSINNEGNGTQLKDATYNNVQVTKTRVDCNVLTSFFQFLLSGSSDLIGFKKMTIYYEPAE